MRRLVTSVTAALVATAMTTAAAQDQVKVPERPPAAPRSAHTWRVTENFEDGKFNPPYRYRCNIPEPAKCTNTVEHTTKTRKAGKYRLECVYNQGGATGLKILPRDYGRKDFGNDVYLRFYIKWDPDFRFYYHTKVPAME